jgi:hypothetical protein
VTPGVPAKVVASTTGLAAFTVAIVAGLAVDNPADQILSRALICMFVCNVVGLAIGLLAERTVVDAVNSYIQSRPVHEYASDVPLAGAQTAAPEPRRLAA